MMLQKVNSVLFGRQLRMLCTVAEPVKNNQYETILKKESNIKPNDWDTAKPYSEIPGIFSFMNHAKE